MTPEPPAPLPTGKPYCEDCRFVADLDRRWPSLAECQRPGYFPTNGSPIVRVSRRARYADEMRGTHCGAEARLFEPRVSFWRRIRNPLARAKERT